MFQEKRIYKHISMLDVSIYVQRILRSSDKETLLIVDYLDRNGNIINRDNDTISIKVTDNWKWKELNK